MSFDRLGLSPELLRAVAHQGYTEPTPVQAQAIPLVLAGRDVLAGAQTGTGKTAAFVLPMLQRLHASRPPERPARHPRADPHPDPRARAPGRGERPDLRRPEPDPLDHDLRRRRLRPAGPRAARRPRDRRRDARPPARPPRPADHRPVAGRDPRPRRGRPDARHGLHPRHPQDPRGPAAAPPEPALLGDLLRRDPAPRGRPARQPGLGPGHAAQHADRARHPGRPHGRPRAQARAAQPPHHAPAGSTRRWSSRGPSTAPTGSPSSSRRDGIAATAIHGNKSQPQRVRALADFKAGRFAVLVATEVAARGLDIEALPHVVNFELPMVPEDYVHRIGRTGRAGVDGDAVSLVCVDELKLLNDIERVLGRGIPRETIAGFEPDPRIRPEPILRGGLGGSRAVALDERHRCSSPFGRAALRWRPVATAGQPRPAGHPRTVGAPRIGATGSRLAPPPRPVGRPRPRLDRPAAADDDQVARIPGTVAPASPVRDDPGRGSATARARDPATVGPERPQRPAARPGVTRPRVRSPAPRCLPGERLARQGAPTALTAAWRVNRAMTHNRAT